MALEHPNERTDSDEVPQLPSLPGMEDLVQRPPVAGAPGGVRPDFDDDSRNLPAVVVRGADGVDVEDTEESDVLRGRNFGGYELVQKIGQGGMGMVYKARQVSLDRTVAIKILSKALSENAEFIKRFEREAKSIGRISHPNLVAVYDFGRIDGLYYMVTEFIEGTNLAKLINDKLVVPTDEMIPLMVHCLQGLTHVSQHHIVHRDIKPDNILITTEGTAKIADFGLAKDVSNDTDLTAVGLAMGTPAYMSPEQCMGRKLDVRSDLYALGVTAYFALTGEKPFTGQSSFEIMTRQREHNPPPPAQLNPRLPKEVSNVVMRMIAKDPHDRYKDATECRDAWLEVGQHIGVMPAVSRSGEYQFSGAELAKLRDSADVLPMPDVGGGLPSALPPPLPPPPARGGPSPAALPPTAPSEPASAPPNESSRIATDRVGESRRQSTERRSVRTPVVGTEPITCPKCGMLNRADAQRCQRCDTPFSDAVEQSSTELETEAQRLFDQGQFTAAADRFAKAADRCDDRRVRAVLRSREREARMRDTHGHVAEVLGRGRAMAERGDLRGGLDLLERHLGGLRDSNASGVEIEGTLLAEISDFRSRLGSRRRLRFMLIVTLLVIAAAAVTAYLWQEGRLAFLLDAPTSAPAPAPVPAPREATP